MASAYDSATPGNATFHPRAGVERGGASPCLQHLTSIAELRAKLDEPPSVPIEQAAKLLEVSVRTLYRRRGEFEHKRRKGHLYFTLRDIHRYIELEQYNPTATYDVTNPDVFDSFANSVIHTSSRPTSRERTATGRAVQNRGRQSDSEF